MAHDLAVTGGLVPVDDLIDHRLRELAEAGLAPATRRAYGADWRCFVGWCDLHGAESLPAGPETVARYLTAHAESHAPATHDRWLATIAKAHDTAGWASPTRHALVVNVRRGIRRTRPTAQRRARALTTPQIRAMVAATPETVKGLRDRALVLTGYAAALRRSELVALDVEDLEFVADGVVVTIRRSKTDQEGAGERLGIATGTDPRTCPVTSLRRWLDGGRLGEGALFRSVNRHGQVRTRLSDRAVNLVLKEMAERVGLATDGISGHSLRAGHATQAARAGVAEGDIARQTRHFSVATLRGYVREGQLFARNSSASLGL